MRTLSGNKTFFAAFILSFAILPSGAAQESFEKLSCVMHLHSQYSGEKYSKTISEIAAEAKSKNIEAVVITDKDLMRWEYGFWPASGFIKAVYSLPSVLSAGPQKYLDETARIEKEFPGMLIIPGVESSPFYYWKGNPFSRNLELCDWHKHMLVVGMERADDYAGLPLVSNPGAGSFSVLTLWPGLLLVVALFVKRKLTGALLALAGLAMLINNYPYKRFEFNNYCGDQGEKPYQELIDYANSKGGLAFWAHPEAVNSETPRRMGLVTAITKRYAKSILDTKDYTGFAIFSEGWRETGQPGGYWDQALGEYIEGRRARPVWAVGELDYGENSLAMEQVQNILWVKEKTRRGVLEALKSGNFYVSQRDTKWGLELDEFFLSSGKNTAICGQEIKRSGPVLINLSLSATDRISHRVKVSVIRNGEIDRVFEAETPADLLYRDSKALSGAAYYRIYVESGFQTIATNPVFVK